MTTMTTIAEWVLVITLNGWMVDVDTFQNRDACIDKQQIYIRATGQAESSVMAWCERRPPLKSPKSPIALKDD